MHDPDVAIEDSSEDKLNRDIFAHNLANSILTYDQEESLTMGIIGNWGSGKSSLINLTINRLKNDFIIIRFDPWFFSNQNNLYLQFFKTVIDEIKKEEIKKEGIFESKIKSKEELFKKPNNSLENYINYIKNSSINLNVDNLDYILNSNKFESYNSLEFHKNQCEEYFENLDIKIIVIIDNIDRLVAAEIVQIFTLVKSVANFEQFIYILSFDKEIVSKVLKEVVCDYNDDYLDKIIQIPIIIPKISESKIEELILADIYPIYMNQLEKFHNANDEFKQVIDYIMLFIKDIRGLKRYKNMLNFYIDNITYDLNINDLCLILMIQLFNYELYLKIKENEYLLTIDEKLFENNNQQIRFTTHDDEFKTIIGNDNWKEYKELLIYLFPKLNAKNNPLTYNDYTKWNENHNISTKEHFEKYFTFTLDTNEVSKFLLERLIQLEDVEEIYDLLLYKNNSEYNNSLLIQFRKLIPEIPNNNTQLFIKAFMKCGDELETHPESRRIIEWILEDLFNRTLNNKECFDTLKDCIEYENNILTVLEGIYYLAFEYGLAGSNSSIKSEIEMPIKKNQVKELISMTVKKVKKSSENNKFLNHTFLKDILDYWELLDSKEVVNEYVMNNVNTDEEIVSFLRKFQTIYKTTISLTGKSSKSEMKFDFKKLDTYHGLEFYEDRVNKILIEENLKSDDKKFCELFIKQLEEYKIKYNLN